ncbi:MAG: TetR/AcrR family transcriptional regulator [Gemmatimonadales bacterium]|nr:TetR/AcrR family transcriptional regulator [Gemmatimonadales bacterium]
MPKVSAPYSAARRRQILAAATRCFARRGFHQTTMRDICRAARLSSGAVYTWFPSKQAIVADMLRDRLRGFEEALGLTTTVPRDAVRLYLDTVREAARAPAQGWMNIHLVSEAQRDPFVRRVMRDVTRQGVEVLAGALRRIGGRRRKTAGARARLLQAAAFGIVIQRLLDPRGAASFDLAERLLVGR